MTLFEYNQEIERAIIEATDEDGVINEEKLAEDINALEMERADKIDNCIKFYKSRKAMAEALKAEKTTLAKRQQVAENEAERMKDYLTFCLEGSKWESVVGKISYRKTKAVEIDNEEALPIECLIVTSKPDKTEIKKWIEGGQEVKGAHIEERTSTIIK